MANINLHNVSKEEAALRLAYSDLIAFGKLFLPDESKPYIQKLFSLKNLRVVLILDT